MESDFIEYNGSLKTMSIETKIVKLIAEQIKRDFIDLPSVKYNIELINEVCNCIEDVCKEHKLKKVDKLKLFIKIFETIFGPLPEPDKKIIVSIVEHLHSRESIKARHILVKIWKRYLRPFVIKKN